MKNNHFKKKQFCNLLTLHYFIWFYMFIIFWLVKYQMLLLCHKKQYAKHHYFGMPISATFAVQFLK